MLSERAAMRSFRLAKRVWGRPGGAGRGFGRAFGLGKENIAAASLKAEVSSARV
jgi:hypothetical protein